MKKTITIKSSNGGPDRTVRLKYSPAMLHLMGGTYAAEVDKLCKPLVGISIKANGTAQHPADGCHHQYDCQRRAACHSGHCGRHCHPRQM